VLSISEIIFVIFQATERLSGEWSVF